MDETSAVRYISGNPLSGRQISADGFIGAYDAQVCVIPEGDKSEFLGWILPRLNKFSVNHSYFSWLLGRNREYALDTNINGGGASSCLESMIGYFRWMFCLSIW